MTRSPERHDGAASRPGRRRPGKVPAPDRAAVPDLPPIGDFLLFPDLVPVPDHVPVTVEFDSAVGGWRNRSRFDVILRGRITAAEPVDSFHVRDSSGVELVLIQFGQGDEAPPVALPGGGTGFHAGFQVYLPLPGGEGVRIADLTVHARTREGEAFDAPLRIGCTADEATILEGPARDLSAVAMPPPHGIVYLEAAEIDHGGVLRVQGWTLLTASPIVTVQVFADGERIAAALHGRQRADVAEAHPEHPNARMAGFSLERAVGDTLAGVANVTVQVLCLSGACHAATIPLIRPVPSTHLVPSMPDAAASGLPSPPLPETGFPATRTAEREAGGGDEKAADAPVPAWGHGQEIALIRDQAALVSPDVLRVEGWAACAAGIRRIGIEVDGRPEGDAEYGQPRPDVAAQYPGMPVGTGFLFEKTIPGLSGRPHEVRILAISAAGGEKDLTVPVADPSIPAFRLELDVPVTRDGAAVDPITGRMMIEGWALARDGMAGIDVSLDGMLLGHAHHGVVRADVGAAFPGWDGAVRSGYNFHLPARALPEGEHLVELTARSLTGETHVHAFRVTVRKSDDPEDMVSIRRRVTRVERDTMEAVLEQLAWRPMFHLIAATPGPADDKAHRLTIASIAAQSWADWRVTILVPDARAAVVAHAAIARHAPGWEERFAVLDPSHAAAWDAPLGGDSGAALTGVLYMGDELGHDALGAFAIASGLHPRAGGFYADEFRLPPAGTVPEAFFKPDFSPALLLSTNYVGRPFVVRPGPLAAIGATPATLMRDGAYDFVLRCAENASLIHHLRDLLSRTDGAAPAQIEGTQAWGTQDQSTEDQSTRDQGTRHQDAAALTRALTRRGIAAELLPGRVPDTWHARRTAPVTGKVSIIIPTCAAKGHVETCLTSLRALTAYQDYEIICVDNIPRREAMWKTFIRAHADKIIDMPVAFNWSRFNNRAVDAADGEFLLFLNDDVEIVEPGWLDALLEEMADGAAIAGARLLYPNRTVQHAGMFLGNGIGRHAFRYAAEDDPGYFGLALTRREVIAVTGACLLVRRAVFDHLGRFDEAHDVINNDLDFCLRAHRAGLRTVYTPRATLIHHELASRETMTEDFDAARFTGEWGGVFAAGDPFFNPHLSRHSDDYRPDDEGIRAVWSGHPLIHREDVKRILVVKLDHIGDFITALPAMRRLKSLFPAARLTVLAAPASLAFAATEAAIDECIPFAFFHARSQLGELTLTAEELAALAARLAPYRFDIAVDFRKHMSTRPILRHTGARLLAGYDSLDRYPWLDIALEWEGDKALQHKRNHITGDLLHLVAAIDTACEPSRKLIDPRPPPMTREELPAHARPLFARPVVAIHPGAGNITKQWPESHVTGLITLLIERNDVAVLLIGGEDDREIATAILERVARPDRIASTAGEVTLRDLPRLLAACALYIGNDSGPKHIAAAMGVPTIGIHSGVVDPGEWAPMGERTVALHRNMSCSPCYLAKAGDCPRGLACIRMLEPALVHQMAETFLARPVAERMPRMDVARVDVARVDVARVDVAARAMAARTVREVASAPAAPASPALVSSALASSAVASSALADAGSSGIVPRDGTAPLVSLAADQPKRSRRVRIMGGE